MRLKNAIQYDRKGELDAHFATSLIAQNKQRDGGRKVAHDGCIRVGGR